MKKSNKKGFTIVELVIVIAVIAILAAVLIPNLSRLVEKANASARLQEVESALKVMLMSQEDGTLDETTFVIQDGTTYYVYTYKDGKLGKEEEETTFTKPTDSVEVKDGATQLVIGSETYTVEKVEGLGSVTVYLTENDALAFDGATEVTTESTTTTTP